LTFSDDRSDAGPTRAQRGGMVVNRPGRGATQQWVVLHEKHHLRWGGDLRRHYVLRELGRLTHATLVDGWGSRRVKAALRRRTWPWRTHRSLVAAAEFLSLDALGIVEELALPQLLDVHDQPVLQREALGIPLDQERATIFQDRWSRNVAAFRLLSVPSAAFASYLGLDPGRTIVAGNGTDTSIITPDPWPARPAVGLASGASPGRGIETLIEAMALVRQTHPDVRLLLWLAATDEAASEYLERLRATIASVPWIEVGAATEYGSIGRQLGRATVMAIPQTPHPYYDTVAPIKLFDSMASGRPVVVTPRVEMRAVVERHRVGLVARSDQAEDIAASIVTLLSDPDLAHRLGDTGRRVAQAEYDWSAIGLDLAHQVLQRTA